VGSKKRKLVVPPFLQLIPKAVLIFGIYKFLDKRDTKALGEVSVYLRNVFTQSPTAARYAARITGLQKLVRNSKSCPTHIIPTLDVVSVDTFNDLLLIRSTSQLAQLMHVPSLTHVTTLEHSIPPPYNYVKNCVEMSEQLVSFRNLVWSVQTGKLVQTYDAYNDTLVLWESKVLIYDTSVKRTRRKNNFITVIDNVNDRRSTIEAFERPDSGGDLDFVMHVDSSGRLVCRVNQSVVISDMRVPGRKSRQKLEAKFSALDNCMQFLEDDSRHGIFAITQHATLFVDYRMLRAYRVPFTYMPQIRKCYFTDQHLITISTAYCDQIVRVISKSQMKVGCDPEYWLPWNTFSKVGAAFTSGCGILAGRNNIYFYDF
jgi:hypothetical protein